MTENTTPQDADLTTEDLADEEGIAIDALTGEVTTVASEPETEHPEGISPEIFHDPYGEEPLDTSRAEFEALLSQFHEDFQDIREGEIVLAKVLRVTDTAVILEFGFKSEGAVALDEFKEPPEAGQEVEVLLESLEDDDGVVVLSKKKADFLRVWEKIKEAHEADRPVKGTLMRKIKGGVTVDLMGVDAFLPGSQIALRRVPNIEDLIGETYKFKIIKLNKRRRNIVVSRRVILEAEREKKRETLVKELLVGQVREGVVKNITDFGAFIDLGGLDGLLHITDMSWGRVGHPSEVVEIGKGLDVKVLDIDWNRERISLGLKQLLPYPWTDIDKKYPVGSRVRGKVVSITNYGAFVELEKGVEGLVHISEMSWTRNVRHPSKIVSIGEEIEAVVLKVDPDDEKISLGMKQIEEDPWLALPVKYPTGTKLTGVVRNLTSFGAFVEIEPGIDGLVHVSDMSWTKRVEHPSEVVQKGQDVEVMVLDVDAQNKRISLGVKQLQDDPWPQISERFAPGVEPEGHVARVQDKGVVVDLGDDIEGFVPASHSGVDDATRLMEYYGAGDAVDLRVIESDSANRRIVLEVTTKPKRKSQEEIDAMQAALLAAEGGGSQEEGGEEGTREAKAAEEPAADEAVAEEPAAEEEAAEEPAAEEAAAEEPAADEEAAEEPAAEEAAEEEPAAEQPVAAAAEEGDAEETDTHEEEAEAEEEGGADEGVATDAEAEAEKEG
ncbi:MAG: 30S ribosomal protein S1 [Gemmatimonadetes bacterium]|nr:30S ribosomal protein S1 [Gemmatimonadota bacterium]